MSDATRTVTKLKTQLHPSIVAASVETSINLHISVESIRAEGSESALQPGKVLLVGELTNDWQMLVSKADESVGSLPEALHRIVELHHLGTSAVGLVIAPNTEITDTKALIAAIELLNRVEIPLYVVSCNSAVDHRLLSQFATLSGGEYTLLRTSDMWVEHAQPILDRVRAGIERIGFISIESPAMMDIEAFFTVNPQMGLIQLSSPQYPKSSISFPLLCGPGRSTHQEFFVNLGVPRLQEGEYLLTQIKCRRVLEDNESCFAEDTVYFDVAEPHFKGTWVNAEIARLEQQLHLSTLLEIMAQSYLREDGSHISRVLEMLEHESLLMDLADTARQLSTLRVSFLHQGSFALPQLNEAWRLIYEATAQLKDENRPS